MKRRLLLALAALPLLGVPRSAEASDVSSLLGGLVGGAVSEIFSDLPTGTTKVPWVDPCPAYEDHFSAAEKKRLVDFGQLADAAYDPGGTARPDGYSLVGGDEARRLAGSGFSVASDGTISMDGLGAASGFNAALFKDPQGNYVLAFRGTELTAGDLYTDAAQIIGSKEATAQYRAAAKLLGSLLSRTDGPVSVIGHSLGGGLANYAVAANDCGGRVFCATYNAAGLSEETLASLPADRIAEAGRSTVNLRNDGDPVSFVGAHVGPTFDVSNDDTLGAHGIAKLVDNLARTKDVDGTRSWRDVPTGSGSLSESGLEGLAETLANLVGEDGAAKILSKVREYAERLGGRKLEELSEKARRELEKLRGEIAEALPGDASRKAMDAVYAAFAKGDADAAKAALGDLALGAGEDMLRRALDKAGITGDAQQTVVDAARAGLEAALKEGGDVTGAVRGVLEGAAYDKLVAEFGQETADAVRDAYRAILDGADAWTTLADAAGDILLVQFDRFVGNVVEGIDRRLAELAEKYPVLGEMFQALGLNGTALMDGAKNIWGVLTGEGTLSEKLARIVDYAAQTLTDMFNALVEWGLGKVMDLVNGWIDRIAGKVIDWINSWIAKANKWIGRANKWISTFNRYVDRVRKLAASARKAAVRLGTDAENPLVEGAKWIEEELENVHIDEPLPAIPSLP